MVKEAEKKDIWFGNIKINPKYMESPKTNSRKGLYEDCEFYRVPKENGKKGFRTISIYRGLLYQADQTIQERIRYRFSFSLFFAALLILFGVCCAQQLAFNMSWYAVIPEGLALTAYVYVLMVWVIYLTAEREMRAYIYRMTSLKLIRSCRMASILIGACAAAALISLPVNQFQNVRKVLLSFLCLIICSAGMYLLSWMEGQIRYKTRLSAEQPPQGAEKLDYDTENDKLFH